MDEKTSPASGKNKRKNACDCFDPGIADKESRFDIFTLCDAAADANGRLSLMGTYEEIGSSIFPFVFPQLTVAIRMRFAPAEGARHTFRISLVDPDGHSGDATIESDFELQPRRSDRIVGYNLILNIQNLVFDGPGCYAIDFHLNNRFEGRLPFYVENNSEP